jgi:predicted membrane-bound mannosyltransferase
VGSAAAHEHPWYYYLHLLTFYKAAPGPWWSEAPIPLLALAGIVKALRRGSEEEANVHLLRFLAFYTIFMTIAYSLISYKTPWCMLGFLHGTILLAGVGAVAIYRWLPKPWLRALAILLFTAGVGHLGFQAWRANFVYYQDARNPYVYAQTSNDFLRMIDRIEEISKLSPNGRDMSIKVIVPGWDCWPLPWYLRRYTGVLYSETPPPAPDAEMIISKPVLEERLDAALKNSYQKEYWGLRYEVLLLAYIRSDLWDAFMENRK